jgi:PAS domain S-box-containing protein
MENKTPQHDVVAGNTRQRNGLLGNLIVNRSIHPGHLEKENEDFRELLESLSRWIQFSSDAIFILQNGVIIFTNPTGIELFDAKNPEDLLGKEFVELMHPDQRKAIIEKPGQNLEEAERINRKEGIYVKLNGREFYAEVILSDLRISGKDATLALVQDITDKKKSEATLQVKNRQQAAIAKLSHYALKEANIELLLNQAVVLMAETLSVEYVKVLELNPKQNSLLLKAGVGWQNGLIGKTILDSGKQSQAGYTLLSNEPVIVKDLLSETRFSGPQLLLDHQVTSGMSVIIRGNPHPYGVLGAHTRSYREFNRDDIYFLEAIAGILASAIQRSQSDRAFRKNAKRLQTLYEIDRAILSSETISQIANSVVRHVRGLLPCIRASVVTFNFRNDTFSILASESDLAKQSGIKIGTIEQFPGNIDVLSKGKVFLHEGISKDPCQNQTIQELKSEGVQAFACVPLLVQGELIGALNIEFGRPGKIQPDRLEVASEVANTLAIAFQQASLIETERRRLKYLDALHAIDLSIISRNDFLSSLQIVVEKVISCLGVDAATILLYDNIEGILKYGAGSGFRTGGIRNSQLRLGEGIAGRAALHQKILMAHRLNEAGDHFVRHPLLVGEDFVAYYAVPLIAKGQLKGVLDIFHRSPLDPDKEWLDFMQSLATQAAIAIDNAELFAGMQKANRDLAQAYDATIEGWSRALDLRDKETEGHTVRVAEMTTRFAGAIGLSEDAIVHIRRGSLLHDIGKMGVPDAILLKPGWLSEVEWEMMRKHPSHAFDLLAPIEYLQQALEVPYCHHEKWDGSGYPRGLKGDEIPLAARIFAVIDVWDALTSNRPYRKAWSKEDAMRYIANESGHHFDPQIAKAFNHFIENTGELTGGPPASSRIDEIF